MRIRKTRRSILCIQSHIPDKKIIIHKKISLHTKLSPMANCTKRLSFYFGAKCMKNTIKLNGNEQEKGKEKLASIIFATVDSFNIFIHGNWAALTEANARPK